ncbi:MAG: aldo/keto reductase [Kiritimatiellaeota bacterium]|nr:aldo/keto reductase [Kiritimatiellota bacterium]
MICEDRTLDTVHSLARTISKLTLGTVQFGLDYGIANETGRPSHQQVCDILTCAFEGGVNCLDTAAAYGDSETVLGRTLTDLGMKDRVTVVTKVRHFEDRRFASIKAFEEFVENSVRSSLRRLRLDVLPVCLFHHEATPVQFEALLRLKEKGLVRHVGASTVLPENGPGIMDIDGVDAVQVPFNIIDKRFGVAGGFDAARRRKTALFTRSVFLQGLVLMPEANVPSALDRVLPVRRALEALAREAGMSMAELALRFALSSPEVTSVLVGVDNCGQMQENLAIAAKGPLSDELLERIDRTVPLLPEEILNPVHWPPRDR